MEGYLVFSAGLRNRPWHPRADLWSRANPYCHRGHQSRQQARGTCYPAAAGIPQDMFAGDVISDEFIGKWYMIFFRAIGARACGVLGYST